jgi:uncharacterized protein (UPF0333 family)
MKLKKIFKIYKHNRVFQPTEKGQVLLIVLVLMLVGILFITSTMVFMGTSFKTNQVYVNNTISLYASEAGIQDGIWNILNQSASDLATNLLTPISPNTNSFTPYDYNTSGWMYNLYDPTSGNTTPINVNTYPVNITLKNTWVPLVDDNTPGWVPTLTIPLPPDGVITPPSTTTASSIENDISLVVTGDVSTIPTYMINVSFTGTHSLPVVSIGCWLPQGFTYNNGSSNLYVGRTPLFTTEQVLSCAGNEAVVWTFTSQTFSSLLSSMGQTGNNLSISFQYTTALTKLPECLPWVVDGTSSNPDFPYPYTWDFDTTLYDMTASAGNTAIEAFVPKSETRMLGNAISGDYVATGGANLTDNNGDGLRETYISSSSSTVNIIPSTATVEAAYLYWAGWARGDGGDMIKTSVTGSNFYDSSVTMTATNNGTTSPGQTVSVPIVGSPTTASDTVVWWDGVRSGRNGTITLTGGSTTVTGSGTNFTSNDIQVGDQITLSLTGLAGPYYTVKQVNSDTSLTLTTAPAVSGSGAFYVFDGYYWACKTDVTDIVRDYSNNANLLANPKVYGNGDGTYSISNLLADTKCVQDPGTVCTSAYAGWSLVIIYSDASTLGHQLYLYDEFQSIANSTATLAVNVPITISGFITPQKIATEPSTADAVKFTVFVGEGDIGLTGDRVELYSQSAPLTPNYLWDSVPATSDPNDVAPNYNDAFNSLSINGANSAGGLLNASGIDIDTFHVPWSPVIVQPGDVTATINLRTQGDGLVSIYVIASFRSSVTSGGAISYLIKRKNSSP